MDLTLAVCLRGGHFGDIGLGPVISSEFGPSGSCSEPSVSVVWVAALGLEGNSERNTSEFLIEAGEGANPHASHLPHMTPPPGPPHTHTSFRAVPRSWLTLHGIVPSQAHLCKSSAWHPAPFFQLPGDEGAGPLLP